MSFLSEIKKTQLKENSLGVQDTFNHGLLNINEQLKESHPLEQQEKNVNKKLILTFWLQDNLC